MNMPDSKLMYCPTCHVPMELTEGRSVSGKQQFARVCRTHGRTTLWWATEALAREAPAISPQEKTASKHQAPATKARVK